MSSKHFCLKWNNFQNNIISAFESLQNTEELTDVTLTCEGFNIKAHKFILSACSPYFRNVFKENPCSHPIVILKDVLYLDLIAIINFMYHGEVLVSEAQLPSFLETAKLLQVSGLNTSSSDNSAPPPTPPPPSLPTIPLTGVAKRPIAILPKKSKIQSEIPIKKSKIVKPKTPKLIIPGDNVPVPVVSDIIEPVESEICEEEYIADINENVEVIIESKPEQQTSILEAALEVRDNKPGSILERSLTSQPVAAKSPSSHLFQVDPPIFPDKPVLIPRTKQEEEPPAKIGDSDVPIQNIVKIEDDDTEDEIKVQQQIDPNQLPIKSIDVQAHHSSQCGNCPHCGKTYSNQSALKYHVRLVHSDLTNMYCCHLCPEAFDYREGYKKHMIDVHFIRN